MPKSLVPNTFDYAGVYVEGSRNEFRFNKPHQASFMSGMLVPMGAPIPVFPGVKLDLKANLVIRSNTMVVPPLNGIYVDVFAIWVPHRIVWEHFPQFLGENDTTAWTQALNLVYPWVTAGQIVSEFLDYADDLNLDFTNGLDVVGANNFLNFHYGLMADRKIPNNYPVYDKHINVLSHRGYFACWNYYFRDENYQRPVLFSKGDNGNDGEFGYLIRDYDAKPDGSTKVSEIPDVPVGNGVGYSFALLMPVNKFHDWATSLLPQAQFGDPVSIGMAGTANVISGGLTTHALGQYGMILDTEAGAANGANLNTILGGAVYAGSPTATAVGQAITKTNLVADLSTATAITINQLRASVMTQRYLEALARGGRRVPEYYDVIYGVKNSVARKDYPEMISHQRYLLGVNQVVATADASGDGWTSHLGDTGAYSLTNLRGVPICEREFTEFGMLHILYCVRSDNVYSQAIPQQFFRETLLDEYNPYFDHLGDVDVPNYFVNMIAGQAGNFGFQEAWWFERVQQGLTVGALNKAYGSLKYWILGESFDSSLVTCTPGYLCYSPEVLNDVFVSHYAAYPQFILDGLIYGKKAGRMSLHSTPGISGRI